MDWNFKSSSLDLSELEQQALPNIDTIDGTGSFMPASQTRHGFSFDLKLGHVGSNSTSVTASSPKPASSPSGSLKRSRGANNGTQTASCLVDGCDSDLSICRDYHRRHKVCEVHSKTAEVTINGQKQRFCQQCSRFHSLEEFDEGKRSCRKRLDGHNRRRRKPQPEALLRPPNFLPSFQGTKLMPFPSSHVFAIPTVASPGWAIGAAGANSNIFSVSSPSSGFKLEKNFPFLQDEHHHRLPRQFSLSETSSDRTDMFCVGDSDCALSLLSSPRTQTPIIGTSHRIQVQPEGSMPLVQAFEPGLIKQSYEPADSVLVASGRNGAGFYCPGMFQNAAESDVAGSANSEAQTLPFHWD